MNKRFALLLDEAIETIAIWGSGADATEPELGVTTAVQDFLPGQLRQQC